MIKKIKIVLILLILSCPSIFAQNEQVRAFIDTNNILIGDQINLSLSAKLSKNKKVIFPAMPDSIGKIVFINQKKTDTSAEGNNLKYVKKFVITSFDSGEYTIKGFPILVIESNTKTDTIYTNDIYLKFRTVKVDTSQAFKDIKPIIEVPLNFWDFFPYILAILATALIIYLVYYFKNKYKKRHTLIKDYDPSIPAYLLALEGLKQLEAEKLWQRGYIKQYQSQLSEIIRLYIERQYEVIALEQTTNETISELSHKPISSEILFILKNILDLADMVKFAKYSPIPDEHTSALKNAIKFVEETSGNILTTDKTEPAENV